MTPSALETVSRLVNVGCIEIFQRVAYAQGAPRPVLSMFSRS